MLQPQCFTREWLDKQRQAIGSRNPVILEKAIVALQLLGHLAETGLPFQFVGGTSLLLRLHPIRRLSIDIDIVTQAGFEELQAVLKQVSNLAPFTGYEHDDGRDRDLPPKKHFRFQYPSAIEQKTDHILLDVLFEQDAPVGCELIAINTPFIDLERGVRVAVPTVEGLLGDKLTAFAPKTIGILYDDKRKTDIVKQLFDVGSLFDAAQDLSAVKTAYAAAHARQLRYRNAKFSIEETLNDTIEAGFGYSQLDLKGATNSKNGLLLRDGVKSLRGHLVNLPFQQDQARIAAAKAAHLAACLQRNGHNSDIEHLRYRPELIEKLRNETIQAPWQPLNSLKGGNTEAFYYWLEAQRTLNGITSPG